MKNNVIKILLLVFAIAYVVSPVDAVAGPIDDLIVIVCSYIGQHKLGTKKKGGEEAALTEEE